MAAGPVESEVYGSIVTFENVRWRMLEAVSTQEDCDDSFSHLKLELMFPQWVTLMELVLGRVGMRAWRQTFDSKIQTGSGENESRLAMAVAVKGVAVPRWSAKYPA